MSLHSSAASAVAKPPMAAPPIPSLVPAALKDAELTLSVSDDFYSAKRARLQTKSARLDRGDGDGPTNLRTLPKDKARYTDVLVDDGQIVQVVDDLIHKSESGVEYVQILFNYTSGYVRSSYLHPV